MKTSDLLALLAANGLSLLRVNDKIRATPADLLTNNLRQHIRKHKFALLVQLSGCADQIEAFEERAAIMEYDAGLPRTEAEYQAYADLELGLHLQEKVTT